MTAETLSLGGPGRGCSRMRVRRLEAGEIRNGEATELRAHIAGCLRCQSTQAELHRERSDLQATLPFDQFAAGVAEKLAATPAAAFVPGWQRFLRLAVPLASAAAIAVVAGPLLLAHPSGVTEHNRMKGSVGAAVFVKQGTEQHELAAGEAVAPNAQILLALRPGAQKYAAAALWEKDSVSMLWAGEARPGPLPTAFEWDGHGRAVLVVRFAEAPIDATGFVAALQKNGPGIETENNWVHPLERP